jgi:twitching motility two-component system response regulator PilG
MNMASEGLPMQEEQAGHAPLIFIVDDSALIRKLVTVVVQRAGLQVQGFADGVELLRALHEQEVRVPELILLDIGLPKMNGFQVVQALKKSERTRDCPIVIVSRRTGMVDHLWARLLGGSGWLDKPFTTSGLLAVVRAALHGASPVRVADSQRHEVYY